MFSHDYMEELRHSREGHRARAPFPGQHCGGFRKLLSFAVVLFFLAFLGLHPWHMEIPRLGV